MKKRRFYEIPLYFSRPASNNALPAASFHPKDETSLEAGIRVQIHSQDEPPYIHQLGFGVSPGFQTFVSCQEQRVGPIHLRLTQLQLRRLISPSLGSNPGSNKPLCLADLPAPALGELPLHQQGEVPWVRHLQHQRLPPALRDQPGAETVQLPHGAHAR